MPVSRISVIAAVLTVRSQKTIVRPTIGIRLPALALGDREIGGVGERRAEADHHRE